MKTLLLLILVGAYLSSPSASAQNTAFTYQGRLFEGANAATGQHAMHFSLYDAETNGNRIGLAEVIAPVHVRSNGLFTVTLNFGNGVFNGDPRWLEIAVSTNDGRGIYARLTPRQALTSTPYAIRASGISGTLPDSQLSANVARLNVSNFFSSSVVFNPPTGEEPFRVNTTKKVTSLNADQLDGRSSTDFVLKAGDTMTGPLNLPVNGLVVGTSQLTAVGGGVGVGTPTPRDKIHVEGGSLRITGSGPVFDPSATGLRLGGGPSGQNGFSWIQSWDGPLALNPHANAIGIGTTNPSRTLHIAGSLTANPYDLDGSTILDYSEATARIAYSPDWTALSLAPGGHEAMRVLANGNVGIGTTAPLWRVHISQPTQPELTTLALEANGQSAEGAINRLTFRTGTTQDAATRDIAAIAAINSNQGSHNGALAFATMEATLLTEKMRITPSGNVGIGTTAPLAPLHVANDSSAELFLQTANDVNSTADAVLRLRRSRGSIESPSIIGSGDRIGRVQTGGYDGTRFLDSATIAFHVPNDSTPGPGDVPGEIRFTTRPPGGDSALERMRIGANGNVGIGTTSPRAKLDVDGPFKVGAVRIEAGGLDGEAMQIIYTDVNINDEHLVLGARSRVDLVIRRETGNVGIGTGIPGSKLEVAGVITCTTVVETSDRNVKENFAVIKGQEVLKRLARVPIQTWNYTNDPAKTRHIGPMAQDFHAAFGVGADDKHIATVDVDGVALAAIQGLHQIVKEKDAEIVSLRERLVRLEQVVNALAEK